MDQHMVPEILLLLTLCEKQIWNSEVIGVKNINRVSLRLPLSDGDESMGKYSQTFNLSAGVTTVTTSLISEPYSIMIKDSSGNIINPPEIKIRLYQSGGVYYMEIYSADSISNVNIKILY